MNSNKTDNGETFLAINTHQPLEGPTSWYEVHLNSEEGIIYNWNTLSWNSTYSNWSK